MKPRRIAANRLPAVCECGVHGWALLTRGEVAFFSPGKLPIVAEQAWSFMPMTHSASPMRAAGKGWVATGRVRRWEVKDMVLSIAQISHASALQFHPP